MIALTLRGKRLDSLVFTLLHEAAHILHHGKKLSVIDAESASLPGRQQNKIEREADSYAATWCIPEKFNLRIRAVRTVDDLNQLSREIGVHRDLIIGRYARLKGEYKRFASIKLRLQWKPE